MNENEMTYTEVVECRAEIRKQMAEVEAMRRERTVAEQGIFQENLLNEHNRHRKAIEEIENDTMKRKAELRNEMERINPTAAVEQPTIPSGDAEIGTYSHNGETWVRVTALGEDFIIAPHDLDGGKDDFNYDQAMARLKELNLDTFNRKQLFILGIYIEEINAKLEEIGGDKFAPDLYVCSELWHPVGSCADSDASYSWSFGGDYGIISHYYRSDGFFRSRPALALSSLINY